MSTCTLGRRIPRSLEKLPKFTGYNKIEVSDEHTEHFENSLDYYHARGALICKLFVLTLTEPLSLLPRNDDLTLWRSLMDSCRGRKKPRGSTLTILLKWKWKWEEQMTK